MFVAHAYCKHTLNRVRDRSASARHDKATKQAGVEHNSICVSHVYAIVVAGSHGHRLTFLRNIVRQTEIPYPRSVIHFVPPHSF